MVVDINETKEIWQLNAISDWILDLKEKNKDKGQNWNNWGNLGRDRILDKSVLAMTDFLSVISVLWL